MSGNFDFLDDEFPSLATLGRQAEGYCKSGPNSSLIKIGMLGETIVNLIYGFTGLDEPYDGKAVSKINKLEREGYLPPAGRRRPACYEEGPQQGSSRRVQFLQSRFGACTHRAVCVVKPFPFLSPCLP